jgi:hypothetical protein
MIAANAAALAFGLTPGGRLRAGIAETGCEQVYTNVFAGPPLYLSPLPAVKVLPTYFGRCDPIILAARERHREGTGVELF